MIKGLHALVYSSEPEELRAFFRDKLDFHTSDLGNGWLIFDMPEADLGVHPAGPLHPKEERPGTHVISFYCDDIHDTVASLKERGVVVIGDIKEQGFGLVTHFLIPGGHRVQLYQPHYTKRPAPSS